MKTHIGGVAPGHVRLRRLLSVGSTCALAGFVFTPWAADAAAPSNDRIGKAKVVTALPYSDTVDTSEATIGPADQGNCGSAGATVWYRFTPSADGLYVFTTEGSDFDTVLNLYSGRPGNLRHLDCNDDFTDFYAVLVPELQAGTTYYVSAGACCGAEPGQVGPGGTLVFRAFVPTPIGAIITVSPEAELRADGTLGLPGTINCSGDAYFSLFGSIRQRQGSTVNRTDFALTAGEPPAQICSSDTWTPWHAAVDPGPRGWAAKRATVYNGRVNVCGPYVCTHVTYGPEMVKIVRAG